MLQALLEKRLIINVKFFIYFCRGALQSGFWGQPYAINLPKSYSAASQNPGSFMLLQVRRKNNDRVRP